MTTSTKPRKRVLSGMRSTGRLHLGNYVGALDNWVRMQDEYQCFFEVADWHALTTDYADTSRVKENSIEVALDWLAAGLDPEKSVIFIQSHVPAHAELHLLCSMITPLGWLERVPTYKEQRDNIKDKDLGTYGFLGYPVLQAADILIYKADVVPVGEDQLQHLELSREIARRFNQRFGDTFPEPEPALSQAPRLMALNDPARKMSKSLPGSYISLADDGAAIRKKIGRAVTDVGPDPTAMSPGVKNLFTLLEEFADEATARHFHQEYAAGTLRYSELKPAVADAVVAALAPIRARREELVAHPDRVRAALDAGAERASTLARRTMDEVRHRLGLR